MKDLAYLSKCIGQGWVHPCCSFTVKDSPLNAHNRLHNDGIGGPKEENSSIYSTKYLENVLLFVPVYVATYEIVMGKLNIGLMNVQRISS